MQIVADFYGGLSVERKETGKSQKHLAWSVDGEKHRADTRSKDNGALQALLPPIDNWKRTHVFAASVMVAFSNATDLSRKQLLEELVGIGQFDVAHKNFLSQRRVHEAERASLTASIQQVQARIASAERVITDTAPPPPVDLAALEEQSVEAYTRWQDADALLKDARKALTIAEHALSRARQAKDSCPTCGAPIGDPAHIKQHLAEAQADFNKAKAEYDEVAATVRPLAQEAQGLQQELASARGSEAANERLRKAYTAAQTELDDLQDQLMELQLFLAGEDHQIAVYRHASEVIQSSRGKVFDDMLAAVETLSCSYLGRLMSGMRLVLEVTPGRAGIEAVKLLVDRGDGVLRSYRALSSGQQRRVDISILLALSQLAPTTGTLFFDEAFDTLDPQGLELVSELLTDFGKERSVVVISPNPVFTRYLPVDLSIVIEP